MLKRIINDSAERLIAQKLFEGDTFCVFTIGIPGSGKTTWSKSISEKLGIERVSSDDFIDKYAEDKGISYKQAFIDFGIKSAERNQEQKLKELIYHRKPFILDKTNMSMNSRHKSLKHIPSFYLRAACVFKITTDEFIEVNNQRKSFGRDIPETVVRNMLKSYEIPDEFDRKFFMYSK